MTGENKSDRRMACAAIEVLKPEVTPTPSDPHSWECPKCHRVNSGGARFCESAACADEDDGPAPSSGDAEESDRAMLVKLKWMRDTVGVDIERMFARALKEKDGRQ